MDWVFRKRSPRIRGMFNGLCAVVLIFMFYNHGDFPANNPKFKESASSPNSSSERGFSATRREMIGSSADPLLKLNGSDLNYLDITKAQSCSGVYEHMGYSSSCEFLKSNTQCESGGFFNYLKFYFCACNGSSWTFMVLGVWLAALFYLLGNTAADYFCCSLSKLSSLLKLSPSVAGVALLPLGNGAPDVFASIAAFVGTGAGEVGLNSVLGGAVFVTCIVVGAVSLTVADQDVKIDKKCFVRDIFFFVLTLTALLVILSVGKVSVFGAMAFVSIYVIYASSVAANEFLRKQAHRLKLDSVTPLIPVKGSVFAHGTTQENEESVLTSLLEVETASEGSQSHASLPQWMWASNVAIYSNQALRIPEPDKDIWGWNDEDYAIDQQSFSCSKLFSLLELPLIVPRRLTIPLVEEENWSKLYTVGSALFAPILLACLWSSQENLSSKSRTIAYVFGVLVGSILSFSAYKHTRREHPPQRFLFPYVVGGFVMSIVWFYMIANELVALLVGLGVILGVNPSILGLTVLAWGNSMGDLFSNVALSMNGGDGVQIAMSGSYAGPMFNTLIGLGVSMLLGAWKEKPGSFLVPRDPSLYFTLAVLLAGLIWALIVLPRNGMRPNRLLGSGLITIYLVFLFARVGFAMGIVSLSV